MLAALVPFLKSMRERNMSVVIAGRHSPPRLWGEGQGWGESEHAFAFPPP